MAPLLLIFISGVFPNDCRSLDEVNKFGLIQMARHKLSYWSWHNDRQITWQNGTLIKLAALARWEINLEKWSLFN